jgi:hypothetical protein
MGKLTIVLNKDVDSETTAQSLLDSLKALLEGVEGVTFDSMFQEVLT